MDGSRRCHQATCIYPPPGFGSCTVVHLPCYGALALSAMWSYRTIDHPFFLCLLPPPCQSKQSEMVTPFLLFGAPGCWKLPRIHIGGELDCSDLAYELYRNLHHHSGTLFAGAHSCSIHPSLIVGYHFLTSLVHQSVYTFHSRVDDDRLKQSQLIGDIGDARSCRVSVIPRLLHALSYSEMMRRT